MSTALVKVVDELGLPLIREYVRSSYASQNEDQAWWDGFTDDTGTLSRELLPDGNYRAYANTRNVDKRYLSAEDLFTLPLPKDSDGNDIPLTLTLKRKPLQRVIKEGDTLLLEEDRTEYLWNMSSNFMLAQKVAEGIDITPLIHRTGGSRVTGIFKIISEQALFKPFNPDNYPNWLQAIEVTIDRHYELHKRLQLNLFCDMQFLGYSVSRMQNLVSQIDEMLKLKKNVFFSLGNENEKNGFDANDFTKPANVLSACGSGLTGGPAPLCRGNAWDIQHQHLRRDEKMFIDIPPVDAPTYSKGHILIFDETIGWANFDSGSRTSNKRWAYQLGAGMRGFNGGTIHIHNGIHSDPLNGDEESAITEYNRGMNDQG